MLDLKNPEINFAIQTTRSAVLLVRQVQAELVTPALTKEDRSPVTVADFACQALVAHLLARSYPEELLVAEESSGALQKPGAEKNLALVTSFVQRALDLIGPDSKNMEPLSAQQVCAWIDRGQTEQASRFWTLDPIDGTKGFLRGDQYAIALALVQNGAVQIGALGCPNLVNADTPDLAGAGSLVIAVRGQGTWCAALDSLNNWSQLHVSRRSKPAEARLLRSFEKGHTNVDQIGLFAQAMATQADPVLMDSQAKYSVLAAGAGDLMLRLLSASMPDYKEKIWDHAAGSLVLQEAGGRISDLDGKPLDFTTGRSLLHNRGILASNGTLHAPALAALKQIGA
jgi:HAL2 family 3'(2'),5'-bisphosphate nucleotidase